MDLQRAYLTITYLLERQRGSLQVLKVPLRIDCIGWNLRSMYEKP